MTTSNDVRCTLTFPFLVYRGRSSNRNYLEQLEIEGAQRLLHPHVADPVGRKVRRTCQAYIESQSVTRQGPMMVVEDWHLPRSGATSFVSWFLNPHEL